MNIPTGTYRHYKGNAYEVICIARDSNTMEECVVYKGLYDSEEFGPNPLWVRPVTQFMEEISVNGKTVRRFTHVKD